MGLNVELKTDLSSDLSDATPLTESPTHRLGWNVSSNRLLKPNPLRRFLDGLSFPTMYFWRIEELKQEMVARPLSDRQVLPYVVVCAALFSAVTYLPRETGNGWDGAGAIWSTLLAALGTVYIYRQNGGTEGRHFLQRYFVIGWMVAIRWLIVTILVTVAYYGSLVAAGDDLEETYWYEPMLFGLLELAVYWRIGHHVRDLAQRANTAASTPGDRVQDGTRVQPVKL